MSQLLDFEIFFSRSILNQLWSEGAHFLKQEENRVIQYLQIVKEHLIMVGLNDTY